MYVILIKITENTLVIEILYSNILMETHFTTNRKYILSDLSSCCNLENITTF